MSEQKKKYDSTVAQIAGNLLSGMERVPEGCSKHEAAVVWAVRTARAIVAETERTQEPTPWVRTEPQP